jgi:rhodanese-related sulfurtransferase
MTSEKSPQWVKSALSREAEIAFLDVREHGQYGEGHPFFVVNCPFSVLEAEAPRLVPNKSVCTVLLDDGDGVATWAAKKLTALGYTDVSILAGGAPGWNNAGFTLFKGVNLPSKAYGEMVEHDAGTPSVSAEELQAMIDAGENMIVLDGRTPAEFRKMSIPTALSCPNAELGLRIGELVDNPDTRIIVNCAGRTRSIIGAQTLRNLGYNNQIYALRNGTQGWMLAGLTLQHGEMPLALPEPGASTLADVAERRAAFIEANDIPLLTLAEYETLRNDDTRTTYLFDVRSVEEFAKGTMSGADHAPGGQLVQATDQWVGVRGARIVLTDNNDIRAATTAFWLRRMGCDALILDVDVRDHVAPRPQERDWMDGLTEIAASDVAKEMADGAQLLDASPGRAFREGHIQGATWAIRPRLNIDLLDPTKLVIVAGEAPAARRLVALDLLEAGFEDVRILTGASTQWADAGLSVIASQDTPPDKDMIDFLFFVHDRHDGSFEAARRYLEWETGLIDQMDEQEKGAFTRGPIPEITGDPSFFTRSQKIQKAR